MKLADLMLCLYLLASLAMGLTACSHDDRATQTTNDLGPLRTKAAHYLTWSRPKTDAAGFDVDDQCDAIQRSCFRVLAGEAVNYASAQDPAAPGRWYRDSARSCGPANGTSNSSFSRDMALGLGLCLWQKADVANAKAFLAYADAHGGAMGDGPADTTRIGLMVTHLYKTLIAKAESTPLPERPADPNPNVDTAPALTDVLTGFQAHITMVGILWDGLMYGGLTPVELEIVKDQAKRQPRNALYQAILHKFTDGDQSVATSVLMDKSLFPEEHLPTSAERCASYLWERDNLPGDWGPCSPGTEFSGTDFLFVFAVVDDEIREPK